jgi:hypothetical protein
MSRLRGAVKKFPEFFDIDGPVHHEFATPGQSVTGHLCVQVFQGSRHAIRRKWSYKWQGQWFLHHNNAPSHTSLVVQQVFVDENIPTITQPPYSPDLAPNYFWLFLTLKMGLYWTRFATMEGIKSIATAELPEDPKRSLPLVLATIRELKEQVCYFECDYVSVAVCPAITVKCHNSVYFLTEHCICPAFACNM